MTEEKITYEDLKPYEFIFTKAPSLLLGTMIRRKSNLVEKFKPQITSKLDSLNEKQQKQLHIILNSDVKDLQEVFKEAYQISGKKQYKQLSEPKATEFLEKNLSELEKLI